MATSTSVTPVVTIASVATQAESTTGFRSGQIEKIVNLMPKVDFHIDEIYTLQTKTGPATIAVCRTFSGKMFRLFLPFPYRNVAAYRYKEGEAIYYLSIKDIDHRDYLNDPSRVKEAVGFTISQVQLYPTSVPVSRQRKYAQPRSMLEIFASKDRENEVDLVDRERDPEVQEVDPTTEQLSPGLQDLAPAPRPIVIREITTRPFGLPSTS